MKLTLAAANELRADHACGITVAECARKYGVSWNHAKRVIVGENRTGAPHASRFSDEKIDAIRRHLANGDKVEWIALVEGCSASFASKIRNNRGRFAA